MLVQPTQWPQKPKINRPPHVVIIIIGATIAETLTGCTPNVEMMDWLKFSIVAFSIVGILVVLSLIAFVAARFCAFNESRTCSTCSHCHKYRENGRVDYRCDKFHEWVDGYDVCGFHEFEGE